ncbi:hypothetical protein MG290_12460 [Flavobacterium sp. CBA20B-1]|uniref:hypothetical protein n=1 Tax=unclassified Flavobacterium TaxID=196869 RepID=UPI0022251D2B|nr:MULTISPECIES: hypothetical protein [unclassified Flavobacterium]WCM41747.1 hypothetical protein MG290_12460 [Flavobacterium sp. CBA20B-1]
MKKLLLLVALFIVPIVAYLFFASGVNSFIKLPVVTEKIAELPSNWQPLSENPVQLKNKITILGFPGTDIKYVEGNITNLAHKIYDRNKDFVDFQVVMIAPKGTEEGINKLNQQLGVNIDLKNWYYVMADANEIEQYHKQLGLVGGLDDKYGTSNVYIIDKELNLRGRKGKNKKGEEEYREGYNTISAADLHNEMADDVKVILAEYRLALKKNNRIDNVTN